MAEDIPTEVKKEIVLVSNLQKYMIREFYELRHLLNLIKRGKDASPEENKRKIDQALHRLKGMFGAERVERREMKKFTKMKDSVKKVEKYLLEHNSSEAKKLKELLEKAEVYNNYLVRVASRGGTIEAALKEAKANLAKFPEAIRIIEESLRDISALEEQLRLVEKELDTEVATSVNETVNAEAKVEAALFELRRKKKDLIDQITKIRDKFGYRETFLGGRLWGNRKKVLEEEKLHAETVSIEEEIIQLEQKLELLKKKSGEVIHRSLSEYNDNYSEMFTARNAVLDVKTIIDKYLPLLEEALISLSSSMGLEVAQLLTRNKYVALGSSGMNVASQWKVEAVVEATPRVRKAVDDYYSKMHHSRATEVPLLGGMNIAFDILELIPSDFLSVFALWSLTEKAKKIKKIKVEVELFQQELNKEYNSLQAEIIKHTNRIKYQITV